MGRKSITGGVIPAGPHRIQFDFRIEGQRFRPTLPWVPHESNLRRARAYVARIKAQIAAGTFSFADEFPRFKGLSKLPPPLRARTCGEVFDAFLSHEEARLARGDLAAVTVSRHRRILDHVWRPHLGALPLLGITYSMLVQIADAYPCNKKTYNNAISALRRAFAFGYLDYPERRDPSAALKCARLSKKDRPRIDPFSIQDAEVFIATLHCDWGEAYGNYDELRFFTGLRPSEEIALAVTDYDAMHGVLSVTKARVNGIDQDVTKTGEDRRILLCPRAVVILERHLRLREQRVRAGDIQHESLFFTDAGAPIANLRYGYWRWHRTLRQLPIRYRKPYVARHTSVSWNLMVGRNPLLVAKEHGHRLTTMLTVYAAWAEGAVEADIVAIREAMNRTDRRRLRRVPRARTPTEPNSTASASERVAFSGRRGKIKVLAAPEGLVPPAGTLASAGPLGSGLVSSPPPWIRNSLNVKDNFGGKGGTRTLDPGIMRGYDSKSWPPQIASSWILPPIMASRLFVARECR
jgi:integrase